MKLQVVIDASGAVAGQRQVQQAAKAIQRSLGDVQKSAQQTNKSIGLMENALETFSHDIKETTQLLKQLAGAADLFGFGKTKFHIPVLEELTRELRQADRNMTELNRQNAALAGGKQGIGSSQPKAEDTTKTAFSARDTIKQIESLVSAYPNPAKMLMAGVDTGFWFHEQLKISEARKEAELLAEAAEWVKKNFAGASTEAIRRGIRALQNEQVMLQERSKFTLEEKMAHSSSKFMEHNGIIGGNIVGGAITFVKGKGPSPQVYTEMAENRAKESALTAELNRREVHGNGFGGIIIRKCPSAAESLVANIRDQMRYLDADGAEFIPALEELQAKLAPKSGEAMPGDWKLVTDLLRELQTTQTRNMFQVIQDTLKYDNPDRGKLQQMLDEQKTLRDGQTTFGDDGLVNPMWVRHQSAIDDIQASIDKIDLEPLNRAAWEYGQGLLTAEGYASMLADEMSKVGRETEHGRENFATLQSVAKDLTTKEVERLNEQLSNGTISTEEWQQAVDKLIETYSNLPMVKQDLEGLNKQQSENAKLQKQWSDAAKNWADDIRNGFVDAIVEGKNFNDVLSNIGMQMAKLALNQMLFGSDGKGGMFGGFISSIFSMLGFANGGVIQSGAQMRLYEKGGAFWYGDELTRYASGGIVSRPTLFPMAHGLGLMGEVPGRAEAIMPLERLPNGDLGVQAMASSSGGASPGVVVQVQNNTSTPVEEQNVTAHYDRDLDKIVVGIVLSDIAQNGAIGKAMKQRR